MERAVKLYDEGVQVLNFREIKRFIAKSFRNIDVQVIRETKKVVHTNGLLFDFLSTQKSFADKDTNDDICHIVLSDRIFATLDENNRPHIRASIYGFPSVISIPGIIEGPAKPKEFYIYKQKYTSLWVWDLKEAETKRKFKGKFIDYNDKRLTEVVKGYIAQAIFFYMTGDPFCDKKSCRLYNAHWQKDLIYSQITSGKFCGYHRSMLSGGS